MELCNSPAKLWEPLKEQGINEQAFSDRAYANKIGNSILETIHSWYVNSGIEGIALDDSVHITVSYEKLAQGANRYQLHAFRLGFPDDVIWRYKSDRCLSGYDPLHPDEVLFDWYGLSGGQVKYYPRAANALYSSTQFALEQVPTQTIYDKARALWSSSFVE